MSAFHDSVLKVVRGIPAGKVVSYGQVASYIGMPDGSRDVGTAMHQLGGEPDFPWWRVLGNAGKITIPENPNTPPELQQQRLEAEGVRFVSPLILDIEAYRYRPDNSALESFGLSPQAIAGAIEKYQEPVRTTDLGL